MEVNVDLFDLAVDEASNIFRQLLPVGLKHVSISGGEPLLHPKIMDIVRIALDLGLRITLTTSGCERDLLLNLIRVVCRHKVENINIRVSLEITKSFHDELRGEGTYDKALRTVELIKNEMGWVGTNATLLTTTGFEQYFQETVGLVDHIAFITPLPRGRLRNLDISHSEVQKRIVSLRETLQQYEAFIKYDIWDYWSQENAGFLFVADGRITLPGLTEARDIEVASFLKDEDWLKKVVSIGMLNYTRHMQFSSAHWR